MIELNGQKLEITTDYKSKKYYPGSLHESNSGGKAKVIGKVLKINNDRLNGFEYGDRIKYIIEFQDKNKYKMIAIASNIGIGNIKNPYAPLVWGNGFIGVGKHVAKDLSRNAPTRAYSVWNGMLRRVYSKKFHSRHPSYIGVKLYKDWHNFQIFAEWYEENYPGYPTHDDDGKKIRWQLDKDLLSNNGEKIYGPKTCIFLPDKVNGFIANEHMDNISGHTGVSWDKRRSKWVARISSFNTNKYRFIARCTNKKDAERAYEVERLVEAGKAGEYLKSLGFSENFLLLLKRGN